MSSIRDLIAEAVSESMAWSVVSTCDGCAPSANHCCPNRSAAIATPNADACRSIGDCPINWPGTGQRR